MKTTSLPLLAITSPEQLVQDYLNGQIAVQSLAYQMPTLSDFQQAINRKTFDHQHRSVLIEELTKQHQHLTLSDQSSNNLALLAKENTYTITTGHQLCLFTGPLYFVYKIVSTIKLTEELRKAYPNYHFVPIYWMATEDHDVEEINHAHVFGKKLTWDTDQKGAVGPMSTEGISLVLQELSTILGTSPSALNIIELLNKAYAHTTLAEATRYLVNELFGKYGLLTIDANTRPLKQLFEQTLRNELLQSKSYDTLSRTNQWLQEHKYKVQVTPRPINLFYLKGNTRSRIEREGELWRVLDTNQTFNRAQIESMITDEPEVFSPNVVMRPLYQETILPNLAYVGGPGELAYWLQLKQCFEEEQIAFPLLIHRDCAMLLNDKITQRLSKLSLQAIDLFEPPHATVKRLMHSEIASLASEKEQLNQLFNAVAQKAKAIDPTLENAVLAEGQKQWNALEHLEKKILKSLKTKEETRINQFQKVWNECFPDGTPQERHDNFFQHQFTLGESLIESLHNTFNPLTIQYHILEKEMN